MAIERLYQRRIKKAGKKINKLLARDSNELRSEVPKNGCYLDMAALLRIRLILSPFIT